MVRVFVITCDKYAFALKGFAHQFGKYWSELQPVVVCGYNQPDTPLPANFTFFSIAPQEYPSSQWTTGLIEVLRHFDDTHLAIMLEDYWLCRGVNHQAVNTLYEFCCFNPQVLRMDLTDDRQYNGHVHDHESSPYYGYNDIVETPADSPYQSSLQAGIWNRHLLLEVLQPGESAWQFEIGKTGENIRNRPDLKVLGTRQRPVRYANIFRGGDTSQLNLTYLLPQDIEELKAIGAIP